MSDTAQSARAIKDGTTRLDPVAIQDYAERNGWVSEPDGEDEYTLDELNDRQAAALVWELLKADENHHIRVRKGDRTLWGYDDGVWRPNGERILRQAGRQALGAANYGKNTITQLKTQVLGDPFAEIEADEFGLEPGEIAVANGLLDLKAAAEGDPDALRHLEPEDYALAKLPVEYDPDAEAGDWRELVDEWAEEGRAQLLQEYVGYCLHLNDMPIHRALLLVGSGENGKGTFLHVIRRLLGEENTTSTELQTLANERDAVAEFYGALANIDDDLSSRKLGQGKGMFKKLVAGDRVRGRRLYEDAFEFNATGKHLYAANQVPKVDVSDKDHAFWRRWVLVEFPNQYPPHSDDREDGMKERLTQDEYLSGVLNWAIEGWQRVIQQGKFTNETPAYAKRERWQRWGESVDKFISDCCERDEDADRITTGDVYKVYQAWADREGKDIEGQQQLTNSLKLEDFGYGRHRIDGVAGTNGFKALAFTDEAPELESVLGSSGADPGQERLG